LIDFRAAAVRDRVVLPLTQSCWAPAEPDTVAETTVGSVLRAAAETSPDLLAVIDWGASSADRRAWTYADLLRAAERTACALLRHFRPGEHVAVYAPNSGEWLILEFGAALADLVLVTVNPAYRAEELEYVLRQSRSVGIFYTNSFRGNAMVQWVNTVRGRLSDLRVAIPLSEWQAFMDAAGEDIPLPDVQPLNPAQIQYTSGTTGRPKGALLHHRGLTNNARFFAARSELRAGDVYAHAMPFFHTAGCVMASLGTVQALATHAFLPAYDASRLAQLLMVERATHMLGVPTMLIGLLEQLASTNCDLGALRVVICGGASVPPEVVRSIEERLNVRFSIVYGQTESSPLITQVCLSDSPEDKALTVGKPVPCTEVKIIDPASGAVQPVDSVGEVCARGYQVMQGYFDEPAATTLAIDRDGWLHTGDLGTMDSRGYCRITGRLKDMVIRGGENIFPAEIEAALHRHPAVLDVAVVGVPDGRMGEELAAFLRVRDPRPTAEALHAHVRELLAAPKAPRYWVFIDSFPLTASGKVQKFVLRDWWKGGNLDAIDMVAVRCGPSGSKVVQTG